MNPWKWAGLNEAIFNNLGETKIPMSLFQCIIC